jgi:hypothetical protein
MSEAYEKRKTLSHSAMKQSRTNSTEAREGLAVSSDTVVTDFLSHSYSYEHYKACAKRAEGLIERKLSDHCDENEEQVQAKLTSRAKTLKSLKEKLMVRSSEGRAYTTTQDILQDIKDLAGVRIILRSPSMTQRRVIRGILQDIWGPDIEEKLVTQSTWGSESRWEADCGERASGLEWREKHRPAISTQAPCLSN